MTCSSLPQSLAVGLTIEDLHLCDWDVSVTAVCHGGKRGEAPGPETYLQAGDVLVLVGTTHHLEHAEGLLYYGLLSSVRLETALKNSVPSFKGCTVGGAEKDDDPTLVLLQCDLKEY